MKTRLLAALCAAMIAMSGSAVAQTVSIGTLNQGSVFHTMGSVISRVARDTEGMNVVVQPNGGTFVMMSAVDSGFAEFAINDVNDVIAALQGLDEHEDSPMENLRVVLTIAPLPMGLIVSDDSGITSTDELRGQRLPSGWSAFPLANSHIEAVLAASGMSMEDVEPVPTTGLIRAADDLVAGRLDATYFAIGAPKVAEMNAALGGIRFLPVPDTPEALAAVQAVRPAFYITTVPPLDHLAGINEPTPLVTWDTVLLAGADVPEDTVYAMVRSMMENRDALVAAYPPFNSFHPETAARQHPVVEYHPGAIRYYQEAGVWPASE